MDINKYLASQGSPVTHRVVLRRRNGRYVKEYPVSSRYAAKMVQDWLEGKHDAGYYVEIEKAN
jgi:hypothetical protein